MDYRSGMKNDVMILRPHHGMCFQFYEGKGYSPDFTDHMGNVIRALKDDPGRMIRLSAAADLVCRSCPNNEAGSCISQEKVIRYDARVLRTCGISDGDEMPYKDFITLVREKIIEAKLRSTICGDCEWDDICRKKS
jgi:hypothetical protein